MEDLFAQRIQALSRPLEPTPTDAKERLTDLKGVRAVIFDIYGTCFISGSGDIGSAQATPRGSALRESLREQGVELEPEDAEEGMERFMELIRREHARRMAEGVAHPEVRILDIWEQWRREAMVQVNLAQLAIDVECRLNPVWPMPGLTACLEGVSELGLTLGIVSNAQVFTPCLFPALTGRTAAEAGFDPSHCVWSWMHREAKPSVRLYTHLLERLHGVSPEDCLYIGNDMRNDMAPASSLGMRTALFAGDGRSLRWREGDPLVKGVEPDLILTRLTQVLECI